MEELRANGRPLFPRQPGDERQIAGQQRKDAWREERNRTDEERNDKSHGPEQGAVDARRRDQYPGHVSSESMIARSSLALAIAPMNSAAIFPCRSITNVAGMNRTRKSNAMDESGLNTDG